VIYPDLDVNSLEQALSSTEMILMLTMKDLFSRSIYNLVVLIPHQIEEFAYVVKRHIQALMWSVRRPQGQ